MIIARYDTVVACSVVHDGECMEVYAWLYHIFGTLLRLGSYRACRFVLSIGCFLTIV